MSKSGKILIWSFVAVIVLALGALAVPIIINQEKKPVYCTQDAKLCPDGSYVGRVGPRCEFAACPGGEENGDDGSEDFKTTGTLTGKVSIGPLCPVEPCPPGAYPPNPYLSRELIFTPKGGGRPADLPFYAKLQADGSFEAELPAGKYEVTLSDCNFLGCNYALPKNVNIEANKTTEMDIDIDTGIR